jgi:hypothetical protein
MDAAVRDLVASLREAESVAPQWSVIDAWATEGDVARLRETAQALVGATTTATPGWAAQSLFDRIARVLALTPRLEFATAVRELARSRDPRELASLTASGQPVDVCAELVLAGDTADDEFLSCLVQELVLRAEHLEREPFLSFWRGIQTQRHPLGWLPLRLSRIERSIVLPSYSLTGMVYAPPSARDSAGASGEGTAAQVGPLEGESTAPADTERISSAVRTWLGESNGRMEARVFSLRGGERDRSLAALLTAAGLECLGDGGPSVVDGIAPADAFEIVFAAASTGGAYDSGHRGSYGRLATWQTVGALVGAGIEDSIEQVEERAERSEWFSFESDSGWFYDVAWDIGLAAISAEGTRLAILAATDTD